MLQALKEIDNERARVILASVGEQFVRSKYMGGPAIHILPKDDALVREVVEELSARVAEISDSDKWRSQILDEISAEISRILFSDENKQAVRDRLGKAGRLPVRLYDVSFSENFSRTKATFGVSETHVESAIKNCDWAEHLSSQMEGENAAPHASLFLQTPSTRSSDFTLLVHCNRLGDQLDVHQAFRIYHDEVLIEQERSPLRALALFLEKFGLDVEIVVDDPAAEKISPKRLFNDLILHVPVGRHVTVKFPDGSFSRLEHSAGEDDRVEISLTYAVDNKAYVEQLRRHGVHAVVPAQGITTTRIRS